MYDNDLNFGKGKLYAALPIPAYKALAKAKDWPAQRVLVGLVSFAGKNQRSVYPSYTKLCQITGLARSTVSQGLTSLVEYGLVKVQRYYADGKLHNKYYLQDACWDSSKMKNGILRFTKKVATCERCGKPLDRGEFGIGPSWAVHWGCGGVVIPFKSYLDILDGRINQQKRQDGDL
jgi:hypothetical protein